MTESEASAVGGEPRMTADQAIEFLERAAEYFEREACVAKEDRAYWASLYNAQGFRDIIALLTMAGTKTSGVHPGGEPGCHDTQ